MVCVVRSVPPQTERTYTHHMLGAFGKLRNAITSFVLSARLSVWSYSAPTGQIFMKFGIGVFLENLWRKFKFHLGENNGYFTWRFMYIYDNVTLNFS